VLSTYNSDAARQISARPNFDPVRFAAGAASAVRARAELLFPRLWNLHRAMSMQRPTFGGRACWAVEPPLNKFVGR
jgi:hypothetical protein